MFCFIIIVGDRMELVTVVFRTTLFYFFIVLAYRIMGKREIGQLGIIDLIVAISIENTKDSILLTIIPISLLVVLELVLAFVSIKSRNFRNAFGGKPSLIIYCGKINFKEMVKQRYSMDDLLLELRQREIKSIEDVEYAFLEPNGKLSIFKYNIFRLNSSYPMPLIVDGEIQEKVLKYIHKNKLWLTNTLNMKNLKIDDVFYCFYKKHKLYIIKRSDLI